MDVDRLEARLSRGRKLDGFDREAVETVADLIVRVREARAIVADEGVVVARPSGELMEHPAVKVERMASAEIRGWVKDRPDLFGEQRRVDDAGGVGDARSKFGGFKVVR
ncbi:P27 family phage terminase small subunit [uncultured Corynebacterium sp.]|uniref:P27 family phage terminase small subunit n=1 Tax=uncultured Corynebacterium sp. TaxID=159447 RepID=UPI00259216C2|nr:P27 family phage terminase small subunit [uncultured Corynebacterium sp.]